MASVHVSPLLLECSLRLQDPFAAVHPAREHTPKIDQGSRVIRLQTALTESREGVGIVKGEE
jgi:hypothetical protein